MTINFLVKDGRNALHQWRRAARKKKTKTLLQIKKKDMLLQVVDRPYVK
jgi:hypothetical protein